MKPALFFRITTLFVLTLLLLLPVGSASAQSNGETIVNIDVQGARWIEKETVKSYLELEPGDAFQAQKLANSLRALHKTGFFKDVKFEREGSTLVVKVVENPMIHEITFSGNDALGTDELKGMIKLKVRDIYNQSKSQSDLANLQQAYRIKGLFLANIDLEVKTLSDNRVALTFDIKEGEKSKVREVRIIGNKNISEKKLRNALSIQPTDWLSWLTEKNTYDKEKLLYDKEQLRNVYQDEGFARVEVNSSIAELTPDKKAFVITHALTEGDRYKFGKTTISGDFDELPEAKLYEALKIYEGEWFSRSAVRLSIEKLTDLVGDFGYAFLDIQPRIDYDDEAKLVALHFEIIKGRRVYVNRVDVVGNTRTRDSVIRRMVQVVEGDRFSSTKVRQTKKDLQRLDFFEKVEIETPQTQDPDQVNVKVKVEEKPTGSFSIGAGFSTTDKIVTSASISQKNFLGRGQNLSASAALSASTADFDISFTEPYFLGKPISAGIDLYNRKVEDSSTSSYDRSTYGMGLRLGAPLSDELYNSVSYNLRHVEIHNVDSTASTYIQAQYANSPYLQSMLSYNLNWNMLQQEETGLVGGRSHSVTTDLSGLGGDVKFVRVSSDNHLYHSIRPMGKLVAHLRLKGGVVESWDGDVPIYEKFQLGGPQSVRGFKNSGLGPRAIVDGDSMGGNYYAMTNMELIFPMIGLEDKGVKGITFIDAGILSNFDPLGVDVNESGAPRVSAGVAVDWKSPFGPLRFNLAFPVKKENWDSPRAFDFSVGTAL
ncbi:surface antigen (D15) [Magnetococcus marinus MC-1]|uniref:Outer membrane protein assembly factor BamA n=1 Tax=Magnetococcus marinus (strain ATCC BAA-1437 / JCM 17883 / MC-1) TaxID=156889 RepID=A0L8R3_MAGMM|nr:outer membrane protein assembly factor BamA [Magnetococcus marinus]ABK44356.1 surface antigen (D15) [Magnetococcus marinus MC-1]